MKINNNDEFGDIEQLLEHAASQKNIQNHIQLDIQAIWEDLQSLIKDVVAQMNRLAEFRQRTGGLNFHRGQVDTIMIDKESAPAVYLTLTREAAAIDVHWRVVVKGGTAKEQLRESLSIEIDETRGRLFQNQQGESLTTEEAVFYILRRFLRPALLFS
jgi:hypothetical protein